MRSEKYNYLSLITPHNSIHANCNPANFRGSPPSPILRASGRSTAIVAGTSPPSFDKRFVRDYLETLDWKKTPPAPRLPQEVIEKISAKYLEAYERLSGQQLRLQ